MPFEQPKFREGLETLETGPEKARGEQLEREEIGSIEKLPLSCQDKIDTMLLYLKEKPAAFVEVSRRIYKGKEEDEVLNRLAQEKHQTQETLEKLKIPYRTKEFKEEEEKTRNLGHYFYIGRDSEKLERLLEAMKNKDDKEIGLALGYPKSACEAFVNETTIDYSGLPKEERKRIFKEGTLRFIDFRLSQDNWREELSLARRWQQLIKEKSPNLYEEAVKEGTEDIKKTTSLGAKFRHLLNKITEITPDTSEEKITLEKGKEVKEILESLKTEYKLKNILNKWLNDKEKNLLKRARNFGLSEEATEAIVKKTKSDIEKSFQDEIWNIENERTMKKLKEKSIEAINNFKKDEKNKLKSEDLLKLLNQFSKKDLFDLLIQRLEGKKEITETEGMLLHIFANALTYKEAAKIVGSPVFGGGYDPITGEIKMSLLGLKSFNEYDGVLMHEFTHKVLNELTPEIPEMTKIKKQFDIITLEEENKEGILKAMSDLGIENQQCDFFWSQEAINEVLAHVVGNMYYGQEKKPYYDAYCKKTSPLLLKGLYEVITAAAKGKSLEEFDRMAAQLYVSYTSKWKENLTSEDFSKIIEETAEEIENFKEKK